MRIPREKDGRGQLPLWVAIMVASLVGIAGADERSRIDDATALMAAARYAEAADVFAQVLRTDPNHTLALHGQAMCAYYEGQTDEAMAGMKKALAAAGATPHRALILNLSALHIEQREALEAVRLCHDYLARHPEPLDVAMLDALGVALVQAAGESQATQEWQKAGSLHVNYTARLEKTQPGKKRWGTEWISPAEHAARLQRGEIPEYPMLIEPVAIDAAAAKVEVAEIDDTAEAKPVRAAAARAQEAIAVAVGPDLLVCPLEGVKVGADVSLQSPAGVMSTAQVVRSDAKGRLALLRVKGGRMPYVQLGDRFAGGPVECAAVVAPIVFSMEPKMISGVSRATAAGGGTAVQLDEQPRLPGAVLMADGKMVGLALAGVGEGRDVPAIPLVEIRALVADDLPARARAQTDATQAMYHVVIRPASR